MSVLTVYHYITTSERISAYWDGFELMKSLPGRLPLLLASLHGRGAAAQTGETSQGHLGEQMQRQLPYVERFPPLFPT